MFNYHLYNARDKKGIKLTTFETLNLNFDNKLLDDAVKERYKALGWDTTNLNDKVKSMASYAKYLDRLSDWTKKTRKDVAYGLHFDPAKVEQLLDALGGSLKEKRQQNVANLKGYFADVLAEYEQDGGRTMNYQSGGAAHKDHVSVLYAQRVGDVSFTPGDNVQAKNFDSFLKLFSGKDRENQVFHIMRGVNKGGCTMLGNFMSKATATSIYDHLPVFNSTKVYGSVTRNADLYKTSQGRLAQLVDIMNRPRYLDHIKNYTLTSLRSLQSPTFPIFSQQLRSVALQPNMNSTMLYRRFTQYGGRNNVQTVIGIIEYILGQMSAKGIILPDSVRQDVQNLLQGNKKVESQLLQVAKNLYVLMGITSDGDNKYKLKLSVEQLKDANLFKDGTSQNQKLKQLYEQLLKLQHQNIMSVSNIFSVDSTLRTSLKDELQKLIDAKILDKVADDS